MTKHIIVIGGESTEDMQRMTRIDKHIVASSGKTHPTVLYISTANGDDRIKMSDFTDKYGSAGCRVTTLAFFISPIPTANYVSSLFEQADIIYVPACCQEHCVRISAQKQEGKRRLSNLFSVRGYDPPTRSMMASLCISRTASTTRRSITTPLVTPIKSVQGPPT